MIVLHERGEPDLNPTATSQSVPIPLAMLLAVLLSIPAWAIIGWLAVSIA